MDNTDYKPRLIDPIVTEYLETFGALCIEGPKWCGKTWTARHHAASSVSLGDPAGGFLNRQLAKEDPNLILNGEQPRLIDEWQEEPPIWDAVRFRVDAQHGRGQYILTGSATPPHKGVLHGGTGRFGKLRMRPMSLFESGDSSGAVSLQELCEGNMKSVMTGEVSLKTIVSLVVRGGWPGSLGLSETQARRVPAEYLKIVLEDDIYRLDGVRRDVAKMRLLLRSLARNESTMVSNKALANDIKAVDDADIDRETVANYLDVFDRLFLTENQPPYATNLRSSVRVHQTVKRHLCDPSLACALLKTTPTALMADLNTLGFLFESLCVRDLRVYADTFGAKLYHYRDYSNREADAVLELEDGRWCALEIKLGASQIDAAAKSLLRLRDAIAADGGRVPHVLAVICGMSRAAYRRPDGVFVVPPTALRN